MKNSVLYYSIGALLYCPAYNKTIVNSLINGSFGNKFSLALCLEDTINDNFVKDAENILIDTIKKIYNTLRNTSFFLPKIFIRVREPNQILNLTKRFDISNNIITGFIIPKFSLDNADEYIDTILNINKTSDKKFYIMPILESPTIINLKNRYNILYKLKEKLDNIEELVLNIRVGGNDLCHIFGFRRSSLESIHSIKPISSIFSDIITVFGKDYTISGPVWEYYSGNNWDTGLKNELREDKLCGFIGKTVIHPKQINFINNAYKVSKKDLDDAKSILNWDLNSIFLVSGNVKDERMNEYKTHSNWALKTILLSEAYGVI
ncbi:MAG: HpcH/HpaI aldolase/citrate lyase family protein [Clostridiales bacterium]|jgi:citrate lyase beta subunit|nr:HpcH/HpaI aldolase/citrate lyase family protein [Clostridiales bacterium]